MSQGSARQLDAVRKKARADLVASVNELTHRTAQLTQTVDRIVALAAARQHHSSADEWNASLPALKAMNNNLGGEYRETPAKEESKTATVEPVTCPLSPILDGALDSSIEMTPPESLLATGVADLHERLGGFIKEALLKPRLEKEMK